MTARGAITSKRIDSVALENRCWADVACQLRFRKPLEFAGIGMQPPQFAHLPLILGSSGAKLSKREAAVSVVEYKKEGFLPDALFNYLVRLGWAHGDQEVFSKEEMIKHFTLDKVGKKGAIFDTKKLLWLNGTYLRRLDYTLFLKAVTVYNPDKEKTLTTIWNEDSLKCLALKYLRNQLFPLLT